MPWCWAKPQAFRIALLHFPCPHLSSNCTYLNYMWHIASILFCFQLSYILVEAYIGKFKKIVSGVELFWYLHTCMLITLAQRLIKVRSGCKLTIGQSVLWELLLLLGVLQWSHGISHCHLTLHGQTDEPPILLSPLKTSTKQGHLSGLGRATCSS